MTTKTDPETWTEFIISPVNASHDTTYATAEEAWAAADQYARWHCHQWGYANPMTVTERTVTERDIPRP
jgi:hypothetical protein